MRTQEEHKEKAGMLDTKYKDKLILRERSTDQIHKGGDDNCTTGKDAKAGRGVF